MSQHRNDIFRLLAHAHRWEEIVATLDALPGGGWNDIALVRWRRMALAMSRRLDAALDAARRAVALPDADATDHQHLAHICLRLLLCDDAFAAAEEAARRDPGLVRPHAVALAAAALEPCLAPRLAALLGPPAPPAPPGAVAKSRRLSAVVPWRLAPYRPYGGPHPVITSALGPGSRLDARWADSPQRPGGALDLLPRLSAWASRLDRPHRAALADFLVHRLPLAFHAQPPADLVFHHTVPGVPSGRPWVFHLEHLNMLFAPMITHPTAVIRPGDPQVELVRQRLAEDACLGVFTHVRETKRLLDELFQDDTIRGKTAYIRMGFDPRPRPFAVAAPAVRRRRTTLLFTNSLFHDNFHIRGGPDVLSAFLALAERYDIRLVMRSSFPAVGCEGLVRRTLRHPAVTWLTGRMSDADIDALFAEADIFLLPSGVLHAVSLVRGLRAGLAIVASDVFGVSEFLRHGVNGLIIPGRRAAITPRREGTLYAEDGRRLLHPSDMPPDPLFQTRLRTGIRQLLDNPGLMHRLRRTAQHSSARLHSGVRWATEVSDFIEEGWTRGGFARALDDGFQAAPAPNLRIWESA
ncbi:glycosyltransferase [Azospirillum sp. sgz302134]